MRMHLRLLFGLGDRTLRSRNDLLMENLALRQQLAGLWPPADAASAPQRGSCLLVGRRSSVVARRAGELACS